MYRSSTEQTCAFDTRLGLKPSEENNRGYFSTDKVGEIASNLARTGFEAKQDSLDNGTNRIVIQRPDSNDGVEIFFGFPSADAELQNLRNEAKNPGSVAERDLLRFDIDAAVNSELSIGQVSSERINDPYSLSPAQPHKPENATVFTDRTNFYFKLVGEVFSAVNPAQEEQSLIFKYED